MTPVHTNFVNTAMGLEMETFNVDISYAHINRNNCLPPFSPLLPPSQSQIINKHFDTTHVLHMGAPRITFSKVKTVVKKIIAIVKWIYWSKSSPLQMFNKSLKCEHFTKCSLAQISNNYHLNLKLKHQEIQGDFTGCRRKHFLIISGHHFLIQEKHLIAYVSKNIFS